MKAKELRIGNLVNYDAVDIGKVVGIISDEVIHIEEDRKRFIGNCKPIALTEYWLLKFGFKYNEPTYEWYDKSGVIFIQVNFSGFDLIAKFHNEPIKEIKYVHQLQNLYFVLTGQELTLNEEL